MQIYYTTPIRERHQFNNLIWLRLEAPALARIARPGQFVLARSTPAPSLDPLLRQPFFLAGADPSTGMIELLIDPRETAATLVAEASVGATLDLCAPPVNPFTLAPTTQTLLLAGAGPSLPALLFLARYVAARMSVALFMAGDPGYLPPPFLLPPTVEVQVSAEGSAGLFTLLNATTTLAAHPARWADQLALALPLALIAPAAAVIRSTRLRWERGFAQVALAGPLPCGLGICRACQIETRQGWQRRCSEGPVFDLRDVRVAG